MQRNKIQTVELVVQAVPSPGNAQTRLQFTDQPFLRNHRIVSIETYTIQELALSPLGNPLPTVANFKNAYATFYGDDPDNSAAKGEWLQLIPLWDFHRLEVNDSDGVITPYVRDLYELSPRIITWEKSYITLSAPIGNIDNNVSFLFSVGYIDADV